MRLRTLGRKESCQFQFGFEFEYDFRDGIRVELRVTFRIVFSDQGIFSVTNFLVEVFFQRKLSDSDH